MKNERSVFDAPASFLFPLARFACYRYDESKELHGERVKDAATSLLKGLFRLAVKLFLLVLWIHVKVIHEVSGIAEAMLKKKLESS